MNKLADYQHRFKYIELKRDADGILLIRFHTDGSDMQWGPHTHEEVAECLGLVGDDLENRVVVITGAGPAFIERIDIDAAKKWFSARTYVEAWQDMVHTGYRLIRNHLDIEVPVIAAVNGPAAIHAEMALLADIVVCSETAYFQDLPHFPMGLAPGDGVHIIFPALLGPNRGRQFLLTGEKIGAAEALRLGMVGQVLPQDQVLARAYEHARSLASRDRNLVRHTRLILIQELRLKLQSLLPIGLAWEGYAGVTTAPISERL